MTKKQEELKFTCPSCGEEQSTIGQQQTGFVEYEYSLKDGSFTKHRDFDSIDGGHIMFFCINCNEVITREDIRQTFPKKVAEDLELYF